jgi:hypothetical protein
MLLSACRHADPVSCCAALAAQVPRSSSRSSSDSCHVIARSPRSALALCAVGISSCPPVQRRYTEQVLCMLVVVMTCVHNVTFAHAVLSTGTCADAAAQAACAAQSLICRNVPPPGIGYTCVCPVGTGWYGSACDVCVKVVAGIGVQGTSGNNVPATAAQLNHPLDVLVDAAGNIYIAGKAVTPSAWGIVPQVAPSSLGAPSPFPRQVRNRFCTFCTLHHSCTSADAVTYLNGCVWAD